MFQTMEEIRDQLAAGEDSFAEFKELRFRNKSVSSPNPEDVAGEMTALANTEGGAIFLGVDDTGVVKGIPKDCLDNVEHWVINIASNNCDPPIRPIIRKLLLSDLSGHDANVLMVLIPKSLYVHQTSGGRWSIRVGKTKRILTQQELARLFQQRGRSFVFDEMAVPTAVEGDLNDTTIKNYFGPSPLPLRDLLINTRVMTKDEEGLIRPTVAGLLIFGLNPQRHLPSAYIQSVVYRGFYPDSDDLIHEEKIEGSVDHQIDGALAFVKRFMLKPATKKIGRKDYPQYSLSPVYEALVNAVAHRDYSISGSKIRLFMYDDRLELMSPGGLPNTIILETLPYRQYTRNQLLMSFLSRIKNKETGISYIEARGEGVRKIMSESLAHSGKEPVYSLVGPELMLTIYGQPSPHENKRT
ncbi:MAG: putative DNA binding domain-containing protein [Deltaproteobacteria bacterium]|nr:putative DNA binding domain-containing protein [Deltaproteobacteria bacterium]